ncbi:MAG: CBS domain-containing protein [Geobacter sp.]|nr:CBS domain-containing protein [Geobacter sp.]
MMIEDHVYARPVRDFCRKELILCSVDDVVQAEAAVMAERGISSVIVCRERVPVGIFTDRDLRNKVVAIGCDPGTLRAGVVMSEPLIVVREDDFLFEAVYLMARHGIHRLGVVAADGKLCGMLTESDLIRAQSNSPQLLVRQLESARNIADLKQIHRGIAALTVSLHQAGVPVHELMRLISHLNDRIVQRLIDLLRGERFPQLPAGFAFVVMGSEGRGEQTLKTDQDNAMIYADDLSAGEVAMLATFSEALVEGLVEIGVPECPGGIMAKNTLWRHSLTEWMNVVDGWISEPDAENILHFCMFCDLRTLAGDPALEQTIKSHIAERAQHETLFLMQLAVQAGKFNPPLGFFGGFKVEKSGAHRGEIDLKNAGLFAITEGIRALGLAAGLVGGGTLEKMSLLRDKGVLSHERLEDLQAGFNLLCQLRLQGQVEAISKGGELSNHIAPAVLNRVEQGRLHVTLEVVKSFEAFIRSRFRLDVTPG